MMRRTCPHMPGRPPTAASRSIADSTRCARAVPGAPRSAASAPGLVAGAGSAWAQSALGARGPSAAAARAGARGAEGLPGRRRLRGRRGHRAPRRAAGQAAGAAPQQRRPPGAPRLRQLRPPERAGGARKPVVLRLVEEPARFPAGACGAGAQCLSMWRRAWSEVLRLMGKPAGLFARACGSGAHCKRASVKMRALVNARATGRPVFTLTTPSLNAQLSSVVQQLLRMQPDSVVAPRACHASRASSPGSNFSLGAPAPNMRACVSCSHVPPPQSI